MTDQNPYGADPLRRRPARPTRRTTRGSRTSLPLPADRPALPGYGIPRWSPGRRPRRRARLAARRCGGATAAVRSRRHPDDHRRHRRHHGGIMTPAGLLPLRGAVWTASDMSQTQARTPPVRDRAGRPLAPACLTGLFFLLIKEYATSGFAQVTVNSGGKYHATMIRCAARGRLRDHAAGQPRPQPERVTHGDHRGAVRPAAPGRCGGRLRTRPRRRWARSRWPCRSGYLYGTDPHQPGHWLPRCPFNWATGLLCPVCGATRMAYDLLHADPVRAFHDNGLLLLCTRSCSRSPDAGGGGAARPALASRWARGRLRGGRGDRGVDGAAESALTPRVTPSVRRAHAVVHGFRKPCSTSIRIGSGVRSRSTTGSSPSSWAMASTIRPAGSVRRRPRRSRRRPCPPWWPGACRGPSAAPRARGPRRRAARPAPGRPRRPA